MRKTQNFHCKKSQNTHTHTFTSKNKFHNIHTTSETSEKRILFERRVIPYRFSDFSYNNRIQHSHIRRPRENTIRSLSPRESFQRNAPEAENAPKLSGFRPNVYTRTSGVEKIRFSPTFSIRIMNN